jgi:hypothetical protein
VHICSLHLQVYAISLLQEIAQSIDKKKAKRRPTSVIRSYHHPPFREYHI